MRLNPECRGPSRDEPVDRLELEAFLGNPRDATRTLSYARILQADERGELCADAESLLDQWGFNAEFVPRRLGGRLGGVDTLCQRLRPVFRRDAALGLGYGVTTMMAAVNVWCAGSAQQKRALAKLLLEGGKIAVAYHELDHGNDFMRNAFNAELKESGAYELNGIKQVINNARRARQLVLFARTCAHVGGRSHSLFLIDKEPLTNEELQYLPSYPTMGVRGCQLGGVRLSRASVPAGCLLGEPGSGVETALRSFQITRIALPGMALGMLDTALHLAMRFAHGRHLYGAVIFEFPLVRDLLARAFINVQIADSMVHAAARCLHLSQGNTSMQAAAVKYLVPLLLDDAMNDLSIVLGARFYLRGGEYAMFGKMLRDLPVVSLGHAGGTTCLLTIAAQLSLFARRGERRVEIPMDLFGDSMLLELDFDSLSLVPKSGDALIQTLSDGLDALESDGGKTPELSALSERWRETLGIFRAACRDLNPSECGANAPSSTFRTAEAYAYLVAAGSCLGIWQARRKREGSSFVGSMAWIAMTLTCLLQRFRGVDVPLLVDAREQVFAEAIERHSHNRSFCLNEVELA